MPFLSVSSKLNLGCMVENVTELRVSSCINKDNLWKYLNILYLTAFQLQCCHHLTVTKWKSFCEEILFPSFLLLELHHEYIHTARERDWDWDWCTNQMESMVLCRIVQGGPRKVQGLGLIIPIVSVLFPALVPVPFLCSVNKPWECNEKRFSGALK